jgi:DNA-directed RNA polymerase specialized sigma24 family protein
VGSDETDVSIALLQRALAQGDREVVIQLCWNLYNQPLFLRIITTGIPADQAEDVLQEVFSLLHREYETVQGPRLRGWLRTMTDYECLRHIQANQRARQHQGSLSAGLDQAPLGRVPVQPDTLAEQRGGVRAALDFLDGLPPWEAALLESTLLEHRSVQETLDWLFERFGRRMDREALFRRRHRLRKRLAKHVASQGSDPEDGR